MTQRVGVIGCGDIFDAYMASSRLFRDVEIVACASQRHTSAVAKAQANGLRVLDVRQLLEADDIDIVLILTPSSTHADLAMAALEAGKHVYMEKTIAGSVDDARRLLVLADARKLRIGVAPDTVLGPAVQMARELIEGGHLGEIALGTATVMSHGMEHRHPDPQPFYAADVGPVMDIGPYPVTTLATLLGPVRRVTARGLIGNPHRTILAEGSPRRGERFAPEVDTSVFATLEFVCGAVIGLTLSWDVWRHDQPHFELHGTAASLQLPHYNWFGGDLRLSVAGAAWETIATDRRPFGNPNWSSRTGPVANYRGAGLADMANAIENDRPHRASAELALHVLDVLLAIRRCCAGTDHAADICSTFTQTDILDEADAAALFRPMTNEIR